MYPEEAKPFVLTIHGIRTKGEWQESSAALFRPFYRMRGFKYEEYKHDFFSVVWLGLPLVGDVVGAATAAAILTFWRPFAGWLDWLLAGLVFVSFSMAAGFPAAKRLKKVEGDFVTFWGETVGFRDAPHLVAHSLGTFIAGTSLRKHDGLRAGRVILNGCVLERGFRWRDIRNAARVFEVRNEIARKDWISRAAFVLHGFVRGMGHAGVSGFHSPPFTHRWEDPHRVLWYCENGCSCANGGNQPGGAFVHNVVHRELGHNDFHLGPAHAIAFWLPALWGIPSLPYVEFRTLCIQCRNAELWHPENESKLEARLRKTCWGWTEGPLEDRVRRQITYRLGSVSPTEADLNHLVSLCVRNLWRAVGNAVERSTEEPFAINLWPEQALLNAVDSSLKESGF